MVVITGTPGVGKTEVSHLLASRLNAKHIDLAELVQTEDLICGFDEARKTPIADPVRVSQRVEELITQSKKDVIVDGHYAVDVVSSEDVTLVFVLRRQPDELKETLESYGFEGWKLWENLAAEILDVCLWDAVSACGSDKVCELDVSGHNIGEVVENIVAVLEGQRKCEMGVVDWLGDLEKEGRVHDFLKHF